MRNVLAIPAIGLLAGAAAGLSLISTRLASSTSTPPVLAVLLVAGLATASCGAVWAWYAARPRAFIVGVACAFFCGGALLSVHAWERAWRPSLWTVFDELVAMEREDAETTGRWLPEDPGVSTWITGVLRADASPRDYGVSLSMEATAIDAWAGTGSVPLLCSRVVRGGVAITVGGDIAKTRIDAWRAGRTIRLPVQLQRPSRYLNDGVADSERALARRGIRLVGSAKSGALVEVVRSGSVFSEVAAAVRARARRAVATAVGARSRRAAAIVTAVIIGDRAGLDADVERALQDAGTYHVIAISGGNIAILAGLALGAFRIAGVLGRGAMLSAMVALLSYAYLVGGGASVDRATLMAVGYFAGRALDLRGPPLNGLALATIVLVAADPLAVADPAFLLTTGATLAILVVVPAAQFRRTRFPIAQLATIFTATLAAEVLLMPISASVFSRVTVAGLVLNFAAIPLMAVTQIAGMLLVPVSLVSSVAASWIGWVAYVAAEGLVASAGLVRLMPAVAWRVAPSGPLVIVLYYASVLGSWWIHIAWPAAFSPSPLASALGRRIVRSISFAVALLAAAWLLWSPWTWLVQRGDGRLHVTFVDVGQGDATFVRFPRGATLVVDAGGVPGSFDIGDRVFAPVLRQAGVRRLDTIALTHGDGDHIGGAGALIDQFRPREIWEGIPVPPFAPLLRLHEAADHVGARWMNVQTSDRVAIDGVDVLVHHPRLADWERQRVRNDDSIVIELRWGDTSIVLTGDIGVETEATITSSFTPARLRLVKVPHHGSLTSSSPAFIEALQPRVAVFSAGRTNTFGHPAPTILDRYVRAGSTLFRTDRDGEVTMTTDGQAMEVSTFGGRRVRF